jgi:hypothetical protein
MFSERRRSEEIAVRCTEKLKLWTLGLWHLVFWYVATSILVSGYQHVGKWLPVFW